MQSQLCLDENPAQVEIARLKQGRPGQALHDEKRPAERGGVRAREEDAGRGIAEARKGILGHALAEHARGIVLRTEQPQDQGSREGRRGAPQAEGKDPSVEAPADGGQGLLELEAALIEPRAQMIEERRPQISRKTRRAYPTCLWTNSMIRSIAFVEAGEPAFRVMNPSVSPSKSSSSSWPPALR